MWTAFKRVVRSGFVAFWRNGFVSLASVFVMTIALLVIGSTLLLDQLFGSVLQSVQEKVDINVYFATDANQEEVQALQTALESLPEVAEVTYTSREDALAAFEERHSGDELTLQALEEIGENPLGASLAIRATKTEQYAGVAQFLEEQQTGAGSTLIDRVNYNENRSAIEKLNSINTALEQASVIVLAILVVIAVMITFNTIRLAIYTSRDEISVMRLVGASNTFIRGPFMLQGVMYGFIAGVVALLILYLTLLWLGPAAASFLQFDIFAYFVQNFARIFGVVVGSGILMGLISSTLAVSRYLRV
jgi:cell division transport system permease protein